MTPPQGPDAGQEAQPSGEPAAVSQLVQPGPATIETLRNRPDFLRAAQARRQGTAGFLLQARDRADGLATARIGFTASKKIGNAVLRNRAKRRLRALARAILHPNARPGWDYVLVARPGATVSRPFQDLLGDLTSALDLVHRPKP